MKLEKHIEIIFPEYKQNVMLTEEIVVFIGD